MAALATIASLIYPHIDSLPTVGLPTPGPTLVPPFFDIQI